MQLDALKQTLIDFAANPNKSWGHAQDASGNETNINVGEAVRVPAEQADRNTARILSGTYTPEQYADFERQLAEIESNGSGTAVFPGVHNELPRALLPQLCVNCGLVFRSASTESELNCYTCELDKLCPPLPTLRVACVWTRDDWMMQAHGKIGASNELRYRWFNRSSISDDGHQALVVSRTPDGAIKRLVLTTAAQTANQRHRFIWDLEADTFTKKTATGTSVSQDMSDAFGLELNEHLLDPLLVDFVVAMMPPFMLFKHRP